MRPSEALRYYANHSPDCRSTAPGTPCVCGLDKAIRKADNMEEELERVKELMINLALTVAGRE